MGRLVTDQDEILKLLQADPVMTEAVSRDDKGVYIKGADGSRRYITQLEMEDDDKPVPPPDEELDGILDNLMVAALGPGSRNDAEQRMRDDAKALLEDWAERRLPSPFRPGGLIVYKTIRGKNYVELDWLVKQLRADHE